MRRTCYADRAEEVRRAAARPGDRGWIAEATCTEIRVALPDAMRMEYAVAEWRHACIASEKPAKADVVGQLLERYKDARVPVIGQYIAQICILADRFGLPLITGATLTDEREGC